MFRTTILLPQELKSRAEEKARRLGLSLGEFIRKSILVSLKSGEKTKANDPFWNDKALYAGKVPKDVSKHHDKYLYGSSE